MDQLYRIKDAVANYLSPPAKRRRTLGPETPSATVTAEQLYSVASEPQGAKAKAARQAKADHKFASPSLGKPNPRKRAREIYEDESEDDEDDIDPDDSPSQLSTARSPAIEDEDDEEDEESEKEAPQMSAEDKVKAFLERQEKHESRKATIKDIKEKKNWHADEFALYEKLQLRNFEPLLPWSWRIDFPTIADHMFINDKEHPFFSAKFGDETHARRKLQELITNIKRISSMLAFPGRTAAQVLSTTIRNYIGWSEKDGGYSRVDFIPVITVVQAKPGETMSELSKKTTECMNDLAIQYREALAIPMKGKGNGKVNRAVMYTRPPPVIYSILVLQRDFIFFTMDSKVEEDVPKLIAKFRCDDANMAFWNAVAIAILVVLVRDYMIPIWGDVEVVEEEEEEEEEEEHDE